MFRLLPDGSVFSKGKALLCPGSDFVPEGGGAGMKRLLNALYILDETTWLTLDGENIVCTCDGREKFRLPFSNIEEIYCFCYPGCSPALMGKCAEMGISLNFLSPSGTFLARVQGKTRGNIFLRKAQFQRFEHPDLLLAQNTVAAKLSNTRYLLRRSLRDNPTLDADGEVRGCISYLESGMERVYELRDTETIMGLEGNCAKAYFNIFDRLILQQKHLKIQIHRMLQRIMKTKTKKNRRNINN